MLNCNKLGLCNFVGIHYFRKNEITGSWTRNHMTDLFLFDVYLKYLSFSNNNSIFVIVIHMGRDGVALKLGQKKKCIRKKLDQD